MTAENLWGKLPLTEKLRTPYGILREQGQILQDMTEGLLIGRVVRDIDGNRFLLNLDIVAPSLNNYSYQIIRAWHDLELYPILVGTQETQKMIKCADEKEFIEVLKTALSSPKSRRIVSVLLAQIRGET